MTLSIKRTKVSLLFACLAASCSPKGGKGTSSDKQAAPSNANIPDAMALATDADLPPCDSNSNHKLVYIMEAKTFKTCDGSAWASIDLSGAKGDTGAAGSPGLKGDAGIQGAVGPAGPSGKIVSTMTCESKLSAQGGVDFSSFLLGYQSSTSSTGDTWAYASISGAVSEVGASAFYAANQVGAQNAAILFVDDVYGSAIGGFWKISVDRTNGIATAVYTDSDLPSTGTRTWVLPSSACAIHNF